MLEEAYKIFDYLPIHYQSPSQQEYIQFLWKSYETNDQNDQHTFAFFAYHMLYMSAVYSIIWKIKQYREEEFIHALIGFSGDENKKITDADDWFILHVINERRVFSFLKLLGFADQDIGKFRKPVSERNKAAHSNGVISYEDQNRLDAQIDDILRHLETIQAGSQHILQDILLVFLVKSSDTEEREFVDPEEQINEILIRKNFLSPADIAYMLEFDIEALKDTRNYTETFNLFNTLQSIYGDE